MPGNILFVDAFAADSELDTALATAGYAVHRIAGDAQALTAAARCQPVLAVVDAVTTGADAIALTRQLCRRLPGCAVVILVDAGQSALAGEAMRQGAMDYLLKPFTAEQFLTVAQHVISLQQPIDSLVLASHASRQLLLLAKKAAQTSASVLITGESGTGKERLARYIHDVSPRADGPYVAVNCAAIPETMLEATLFGYARGAFTGASQGQAGKFEAADGGTLLLDEISELPLELQAKLLRVLQEREVERLGSNQRIRLDVRIIAATNKDLRELVSQGRFREDLYYRLDVLPLRWPPLRERPEDILPLARHFLEKYAPSQGFEIDADAARALMTHPWPGNVRELENVIQRALIMARGLTLRAEDLMLTQPGAESAAPAPQQNWATGRRGAEFQTVLDTLRRFNGHRARTADALGVTPRALRYKLAAMRSQGIDINRLVG